MSTVAVSPPSAFIAGFLSFLSPCVLPLIPSYITYITGLSLGDLQAEHPAHAVRTQAILHSLLFIAGFTIVFVFLGASATLIGGFLASYHGVLRKAGGILILLFGLHVTGLYHLRFLLGEKRVALHRKPAGYVGTLLVGVAFAAGWTPCIGPILASILMVAAMDGGTHRGIALLLSYSMGLAVPFFFSAIALHRFIMLFNGFKKYIRILEVATGISLIVVGSLIFTNSFGILSRYAGAWFGGNG